MITVLGASGFIGSNLVSHLKHNNIEYFAPLRDEILSEKDLGDVIYAIGLTADFRKRPFETVEAHVSKLSFILQNCNFNSFTYLSSTRIYIHNTNILNESTQVAIDVNDPFDLFNSSKLTGELLVLNCGKKNTKVVRLSNVYGLDISSDNFITSIVKDALRSGKIILRTTSESAKDYISINDTIQMLLKISLHGKHSIYNLANGTNTTNAEIVTAIKKVIQCDIDYDINSQTIIFPSINIDRIKKEFNYVSSHNISGDMQNIIKSFQDYSLK